MDVLRHWYSCSCACGFGCVCTCELYVYSNILSPFEVETVWLIHYLRRVFASLKKVSGKSRRNFASLWWRHIKQKFFWLLYKHMEKAIMRSAKLFKINFPKKKSTFNVVLPVFCPHSTLILHLIFGYVSSNQRLITGFNTQTG